ncbi:hypothetical protein XBP1_1450028 [Xenorhabdus bovienii str. puntauvense]|uniref:Uncharacterized protein n=1 Tax=Xenorhabdus bovienii str. puntauvense TaxID=1398201 RepID=A0A077NCF1_XENBV|nr:hypothetical protein XBP1_1450028 [Xenorhabdus bovienii str. puntauvense]
MFQIIDHLQGTQSELDNLINSQTKKSIHRTELCQSSHRYRAMSAV